MGFSILQWNSHSIFKKWHEFKNYLSALDDLTDVLCIQESHLTPKYQPFPSKTGLFPKEKVVA